MDYLGFMLGYTNNLCDLGKSQSKKRIYKWRGLDQIMTKVPLSMC